MESGKEYFAKRVLVGEAVAFWAVIALLWLDEIIDIPYLILGGAATPVNWRESLFETVIVGMRLGSAECQVVRWAAGRMPSTAAKTVSRSLGRDWRQRM